MILRWRIGVILVLMSLLCASVAPFSSKETTANVQRGLQRELIVRQHMATPKSDFYMRDDIPPLTIVDYGGGHPFERHRLQETEFDDDNVRDDVNYDSEIRPFRVRFLTEPLEARRGESADIDAQIDFLMNDTLPSLAEVWEKHLSIYSAQNPISISDDICFGHFAGVFSARRLQIGVPDADVVIIVSGSDTLFSPEEGSIDVCPERQLAVASVCSLDQFDRPVSGFINFCLPLVTLEVSAESDIEGGADERDQAVEYTFDQKKDTLSIATHEIGHVLGMDSFLFKFFRDAETGDPLTVRPFFPSNVTCVDGRSRVIIVPSSLVVQHNVTEQGRVYYDLVTPRVATIARNHFNCPNLVGARLENQRVRGHCFGSHWDERLWWTEIMGPRFSGEIDTLSPLTLAMLEDSGWYKVNYEGVAMSPFGKGLGCSFVYGKCIVNDSVPEYGRDIFCNTPIEFNDDGEISQNTMNKMMCDPSHTAFALCDLFDESNVPEGFDVRLPNNPTHYFTDANLIPEFAEADFCPMLTRDVGIDCTTTTEHEATYAGEVVGPDSRCFNAAYQEEFLGPTIHRPACLTVTCDVSSRKLLVGSGENQTMCNYDGETIFFRTPALSYFECPRVATICPHLFCPAECSARGKCNWDADPPKCECFDSEDLSEGCYGEYSPSASPSEVPSGIPSMTVRPSRGVAVPTESLIASSSVAVSLSPLIVTVMLLVGF